MESKISVELLNRAYNDAEAIIQEAAKASSNEIEFFQAMAYIQIKASHTLGILCFNSWLAQGQKKALSEHLDVVIGGIRKELLELANAYAEGKTEVLDVKLKKGDGYGTNED